MIFLTFWPFEPHFLINFFLLKKCVVLVEVRAKQLNSLRIIPRGKSPYSLVKIDMKTSKAMINLNKKTKDNQTISLVPSINSNRKLRKESRYDS